MDHDLYIGIDEHTGREYLLCVYADGTHELASRPDHFMSWGPPVTLTRQSSSVSGEVTC